MENKTEFKPYIPASKITPELTVTSVIVGILLSVIFGAANAYLGVQVGMTVSTAIPSAVISMGIIRVILRRNSILENNMVQTIGSAGESLAAGCIFTFPVLFMWAAEGKTSKPDLIELTVIAIIGGLLGVFFMIPLRNALIVKEHGTLPYPEGTACAEVLLAGEKGGSSASTVFAGMGLAALFKFIIDGLKVVAGEVSGRVKGYAGEIGTQIYPAVMSVGYICGPRIASYMFAGGILSWLVLIPLIVLFGENNILYPSVDATIGQLFAEGGASAIWGSYIRYIGAGALAAGGIISLIKSLPLIIKTFVDSIKSIRGAGIANNERTSKEIDLKFVLLAIVVLAVIIWALPMIPVGLFGAIFIIVFGFFFATVSSRMVGLVGSSNNPVSGMAIAAVLIGTLILKITGSEGTSSMISAIVMGSAICIITAIAGDTSQDLKTGYLLGATPKKQQIGQIAGVIAAALTIGATLFLLDEAFGFDSGKLAAPQANIMKLIIEGVMGGNLPWGLVFTGVFIAVAVELVGIPVLPFAIGVYLPVQLNACIMVGGLIRLLVEKLSKNKKNKDEIVNDGILFSSGMIAGEGLVGILLAVFAITGIDKVVDLSRFVPTTVSNIGALVLFGIIILTLLKFTIWKKREKANEE